MDPAAPVLSTSPADAARAARDAASWLPDALGCGCPRQHRIHSRAGLGRCELPPLFPRDARAPRGADIARSSRWTRRRRWKTAARSCTSRRSCARRRCTRRRCSRPTSTRGFLLLTDLGSRTYLAALDRESARDLYLDAIDALVRWQLATREGELPAYDEALLRRELDLFPDWYVAPSRRGNARREASATCWSTPSVSSSTTTSPSRACTCIATTTRAT